MENNKVVSIHKTPTHTPVDCPTCGEGVDIGGPLESTHFVFAVRPNGTVSQMGFCPKNPELHGPAAYMNALNKAFNWYGTGVAHYKGTTIRQSMTPGVQLTKMMEAGK